MKRRTWILSALGATGALVVGWGVTPVRSRLGDGALMLPTEGDVALNGWIKVASDGSIILAMHRSDMGQGIHTALSMLVAEELDVPLARVRLEQAGADSIYGNVAMFVGSLPFHPLDAEEGKKTSTVRVGEWMVGKIARELGINATGGSSSVADAWQPLRQAAATARASLLEAAAAQWKVPASELKVQAGVLSHRSGKTGHYGEFAKGAAGLTPASVVLKDRATWTLIGKPALRPDVPSKTNGSAQFGIDVRQPGMLFASVRQAPMLGGTVQSLDSKAALAMPGVVKLVELPSIAGSTAGFAVVGKTTWHAKQAALAVEVKWAQRAQGALDTEKIKADLATQLKAESGFTFYEKGSVEKAEATANRIIEAKYSAPYLAHATMEPMNCTAQIKDGKVEIWVPTQVPGMARAVAAKVAGVDVESVTLHVTLLGGGFGRRLEVDFVGQAVQVAMQCEGKPVQLIWSREEDTTHDFYRPMHVADMRAAMGADGKVASLRIKSAGDTITPRWMERGLPALAGPIDMPDKTASEGLFDLPYGFANQHMSHVATRMGVPIGFWRSVGHSHNAFFSESFVDELAAQTKQDPVAFRAALLTEAPRYLAVLQLAAEKAKWGSPLPSGHARGIALHESFGSIVAEVAEVSLQDGKPRVHRVVCAIDCGTVVNPNTVAQQMESGVIFALSAALYGKIDIKEGEVQQSNFPTYPVVMLAHAPVVETYIVPSERSPAGVGEPAVPPLAPAVANALFALTGQRQRALPLAA
ncbi:xanthine dehydrogenase family protein molybdopterin-binding subunit [Rhodoferax aquaticus]|uniref:Xanthine dehydrogenase family protein molybdopterin-binding subunit n=1 Tax=Rhodoferax aquaticus TaxID=2527691 RepID=A0A515EP74_9BURK|nr:xanthine dehydrogenase family protein molybdopterin-binding subunit [Rhodoferax aquaticus]QDL54449.1 xanthine dehydrogenase family protein molybdopterin-binding subunit [Rhodoferax aquaticus]